MAMRHAVWLASAVILVLASARAWAEDLPKPEISSVSPALGYPDTTGHAAIVVTGIGIVAKSGEQPPVLFLNGAAIPVDWEGKDPAKVRGEVLGPSQLRFSNIPTSIYSGTVQVQLATGSVLTASKTVTLSAIQKWTALWIAIAATLGIFVLVIAVAGSRRSPDATSRRLGLVARFLLDPETETYSLSRFQFYAWTLAAVFGYLYLATVWSLVRAKFSLPPIPENLPGIIFISATTSAVATGITSARGPKGAGDVKASLSELITTGAVVAPERVQFFVWTVLGVLCFLVFSVVADQGTLDTLPAVPDQFLYLGGISSFGYLSGKLARKPGPVIDDIIAATGSLIVQIRGRNFSPTATIQINSTPVLYDQADTPAGKINPGATMRVVRSDDRNPEMAATLELVIDSPREEWLKCLKPLTTTADASKSNASAKLVLTLTNPDGQRASWPISATDKIKDG